MFDEMSTKPTYRWVILGLGWLVYFSFGMVSSSLPPLVSTIREELDLTFSQFGAVLGAWPLTYIAVAYVEGMLIDRFGIRKSVALAGLLLSLSAFLRSLAWDYVTLFIAVAVFGLGGPMVSIGLPKSIAVWFSGRERGTATGIYITGLAVGSSFALAVTSSLVSHLAGSWRNTFLAYSIGAVLVAGLWYVLGRDSPDIADTNEAVNRTSKDVFREALRNRNVWLVVIVGFAGFMTNHGLRSWLPTVFELQSMTSVEAGVLASVPMLAGMLGSICINRVSAQLTSRKPVLLALLATTGVGILLMGTSSGPVLWAIAIVYGFCSGALLPLLMLVLMDMRDVGKEHMAAAGGLYFTVGEIGGFGGPSIMGYINDRTGSFLPSFVVFSILTEMMLIPTFILEERR